MTSHADFHDDCLKLAQERLDKGVLDRRSFNAILAFLGGATVAGLPKGAAAQSAVREVVLANFGGIASQAQRKAYGEPFEARNPGFALKIDSSGPSAGKMRAMIEARKVIWDVVESSAHASIEFGRLGYLEEIDYTVVDRTKAPVPGFALPYGYAPYSFSTVLAYNSEKFKDNPPRTWTDFWDLKKYPGKRMLRKQVHGVLDAAVMSTGVAPADVYPIDVAKGFERIRQIKGDCVFWNSGSESEQIMRQGEAVMGLMWHTRARVLNEETKGKIDFTFNQGILQPGTYVVMKNGPGGREAAMRFLASIQEPQGQLEIFRQMGNGPVTPEAIAMIPPELRRFDPMSPENLKVQCIYNGDWYAEKQAQLIQQYLDLISS